MKPVITIGITSYKRINELERCIASIKTQYDQDVEILVSEDRSPLSEDLRKKIEELAQPSRYHLRFTRNERNLGYDKNLGAIIEKVQGDYIFFLSDDLEFPGILLTVASNDPGKFKGRWKSQIVPFQEY